MKSCVWNRKARIALNLHYICVFSFRTVLLLCTTERSWRRERKMKEGMETTLLCQTIQVIYRCLSKIDTSFRVLLRKKREIDLTQCVKFVEHVHLKVPHIIYLSSL